MIKTIPSLLAVRDISPFEDLRCIIAKKKKKKIYLPAEAPTFFAGTVNGFKLTLLIIFEKSFIVNIIKMLQVHWCLR